MWLNLWFGIVTDLLTNQHVDQDLREISRLTIQQEVGPGIIFAGSGNLRKKILQFYVFRFSCMLECHKTLYFCLIRGFHGILIGAVCSPNYSWFSSACPPRQTCQMCVLKIKQLACLLPTCHVYVPRVQVGVEHELHTSKCLSATLNPSHHQLWGPGI